MKNLFAVLFVIITIVSCNNKKQPSTLYETSPTEAGFSSERLAFADTLINQYINNNWLPGGVFLVARHGKIVYYKNHGYSNVSKDKAFQKDDIFRIASMTKAITSVAIMQLYEKGKLELDNPLYNYIPAFKETGVIDTFNEQDSSYTTVPLERAITIRDLLRHTSGIVYGGPQPEKINKVYAKYGVDRIGLSHDLWNSEEAINQLAKVPLAFQPGERYFYGLSVDVLGRVVEVVSGKSLASYFEEKIFKPLGMTDTYFYLPEEKKDRLVPILVQRDSSITTLDENLQEIFNYPLKKDNGLYAGGGGLSSTTLDYARFIQALVNDGKYNGYQLLGRNTIELMTSDQLIEQNKAGKGISQTPGITFCLGFQLYTEQAKSILPKSPGTFEWGGYFSTQYFIDPEEGLIFVGMTQMLPFQHSEFYPRLYSIIYGAIE